MRHTSVILFVCLYTAALAFVPQTNLQVCNTQQRSNAVGTDRAAVASASNRLKSVVLQGSKKGQSIKAPPIVQTRIADASFEKQELNVIFKTMEKNDVHFQSLGQQQKDQIQTFCDALLKAGSPLRPSEAISSGEMLGKWRLEYSSEEKYKILPPGSDVYNYIFDRSGGRLDSVLVFPKSPLVRSIRVICDHQVAPSGLVNFDFKKTLVDFFGITIPIPTFGQTSAFIEMQYFDGDLWMESFEEQSREQPGVMKHSINVYRKVGTLTDADRDKLTVQSKDQMR